MALQLDLIGKPLGVHTFEFDPRNVILYALGVGAGPDELPFVYEGRGLRVVPSFAVIPAFDPMIRAALALGGDLRTLLHGEQSFEIRGPLPTAGTLTTESTIRAVHDKGKGVVVVIDSVTRDERGERLFDNMSAIFLRGQGGFGGDPGPKAPAYPLPADVPATFTEEAATSPAQALLYRLSGDRNPLHADPQFAMAAGFERPILHGLCSMGYLCRDVVKHACGGDPTRLQRLAVRFTNVVFPGDTLTTVGHDMGGGVFHLEMRTGRGTVVLSNAVAHVRD